MMRSVSLAIVFAGLVATSLFESSSARPQNPAAQHPAKTQKLSNPLNDLLQEAQKAIERQEFAAAVEPLQKVVAEQPGFAYAHFQLGYVFTALKRWDEAKSAYERAAALDPKMAEAHLNLGLLLLDRDPVAAVQPLERAVELLPAQSRPRFLLGYARERAGDLPGAVQAYEGAETLDPRDYETEFAFGRALLLLNRAAEAEKKFRRSLEIKSDSAPARLGLADSLAQQGSPEAAAAFRAYLELKPEDRDARLELARFLFTQKEYRAALAELDAAQAGQQPSLDALKLRADILIAQSRWDESIAVLERALALQPRNAVLRAGLGRIHMQKRDFLSAERELKAALAVDPRLADAWRDLSATYYLAGNCPAALAALEQLARLETPNAGSWFVRATCYDRGGQLAEAVEAYQKFLDADESRNQSQELQAQVRIRVLKRRLEEKKR
jgi:tetratricopeptide (TPR) repeat protein